MPTPRISIIVPVYNVEKYLPQCLDSLTNQTLTDIEIIAVNDGSTDNSLQILEDYQARFPQLIRVFTTVNSGVSHARNYGFAQSAGEYIWFVDSDDFVEPNACEILYEKATRDGNDLVLFQRYDVNADTGERSPVHTPYANDNFQLIDKKYEFTMLSPFPWNKLIHRNLFNKWHFPEGIRFEDLPISFLLSVDASSIGVVDHFFYNYRKKVGFLGNFTSATLDIVKAVDYLRTHLSAMGLLDNYRDELDYITIRHFFVRFEDLQYNYDYDPDTLLLKQELINKLWDYIETFLPDWKANKYVRHTLSDRFITKMQLLGNRDELLHFINSCKSLSPEQQDAWMNDYYIAHPAPAVCTDFSTNRSAPPLKDPRKSYQHFRWELPVDPELVFLSSGTHTVIGSEIFHLLLLIKEQYPKLHYVLSIEEDCLTQWNLLQTAYQLEDTTLVHPGSEDYVKMLASARYLVSDCNFPSYFYKKEGQSRLTSISALTSLSAGGKVERPSAAYMNIQRNILSSDYILTPRDNMEEYYKRYDVPTCSTLALTGSSPALCAAYSPARREQIRQSEGLQNKQIIFYVPFSLCTANPERQRVRYNRLLTALYRWDIELKSGQFLYVFVPPSYTFSDAWNDFKNIAPMPKSYQLFDFMNCADFMVSDYYGMSVIPQSVPQKNYWFNHDYYSVPSKEFAENWPEDYGYTSSPVQLMKYINESGDAKLNYEPAENLRRLLKQHCNIWIDADTSSNTGSGKTPQHAARGCLYFTDAPITAETIAQLKKLTEEHPLTEFWMGLFYKKYQQTDELLHQLPEQVHYLLLNKSEVILLNSSVKIIWKMIAKAKFPKSIQVKLLDSLTSKIYSDYPGNIHFQRIYLSKDCDALAITWLSRCADEVVWL